MSQERANSIERAPERTRARMLSIATRARFATPGPWGYVRPSGVICAPDSSEVSHCLHDPDAIFIAHARADTLLLLDQLQAERSADLALDAQLLDRLLVLRAAIRGGQRGAERPVLAGRRAERLGRRGSGPRPGLLDLPGGRGGRRRLGPRDLRAQGRRFVNGVGMWAGPPAASGASAARPNHATPPSGEGVVAPLT
jgi:hypothetical protein